MLSGCLKNSSKAGGQFHLPRPDSEQPAVDCYRADGQGGLFPSPMERGGQQRMKFKLHLIYLQGGLLK